MFNKIHVLLICYFVSLSAHASGPGDRGLLFYVSGSSGFTADYSRGGTPEPNYRRSVRVIQDGAIGPGFQCENTQLLSYRAPGNIFAERGTLSFFWRSRYPAGETPFPVFRVGYADHSSWDMVWLRIDYNGHGFDAFVTDASLARTRISCTLPVFPGPEQWTHLALSWDETLGIRFYVNGVLAGRKDTSAVYFSGLDQFGPHSRIISPYQVQSAYNFIRGGDIDEIRIYDRMLSGENIASLAKGEAGIKPPSAGRDLNKLQWRNEWRLRYGWEDENPPGLPGQQVAVRKVEIHDVYDLKRWWWKGTDGIRETTWPGVYNRSSLPGRLDYFVLPDWDCYSVSGQSVTFTLPDEEWNHIEISGAAGGDFSLLPDDAEKYDETELLFNRPMGREKTVHRLVKERRGGKIQFDNTVKETPIGEFAAFCVKKGQEPQGEAKAYTLKAEAYPSEPDLKNLTDFINGRYLPDEQATMMAVSDGTAFKARPKKQAKCLPLVHVLVPEAGRSDAGLDGIAIDLPGFSFKPAHGEVIPFNIQVKDPIWPIRNMMDFSFSVKRGEPHTLWLDMRDRILPEGIPLYFTIACANGEFSTKSLDKTQIRLIYKSRAQALKEHEEDRFTQARDLYAMILEEHPRSERLGLYNRFMGDIGDLLRVNPDHLPGKLYLYDMTRKDKPETELPEPPPGVPEWAFLQVENVRHVKHLVMWYINERQIENGEFGGGLSDDGDLTNLWPGTALLGCEPDAVRESLLREMEAFYGQGMFENGLNAIQADELHCYEEGIQVLGQCLLLDYGNPKHIERAMETSRALFGVTGINQAGHRHFLSSYFSGSKIAREDPWQSSKPSSYLILHPAYMLARYNGNPLVSTFIVEMADGLLAHMKEGEFRNTVHFPTDQDSGSGVGRIWPLFAAAYRFTGDAKYSGIIPEKFEPSRPFNETQLSERYRSMLEECLLREYINTEGHVWTDRVSLNTGPIQEDRLGGVALTRNSLYPFHAVSWRFREPACDESVAIYVDRKDDRTLLITAYNLDTVAVSALMTPWEITGGKWRIVQGIDDNRDGVPDSDAFTRKADLDRGRPLEILFAPGVLTVLHLEMESAYAPVSNRCDLGISGEDVTVEGKSIRVRIHSLGSLGTPETSILLADQRGKTVSRTDVPAMEAPADLFPRTLEVTLPLHGEPVPEGCRIIIDPDIKLKEITRLNNEVKINTVQE